MAKEHRRSKIIEINLEAAIEQAKNGENEGIVTLFRAFNPQLIRFLRHQVPIDYEDVASETWIAIARGIKDFTGDSLEFRSWMFGITRKKVIDQYRRDGKNQSSKERERSRGEAHFAQRDLTAEPALSNLSAAEAIELLVDRLPPHHVEIILLRVVADLSVEQVAKIVGKSPEAVRVIQHRAINTLVKKFNKNSVT